MRCRYAVAEGAKISHDTRPVTDDRRETRVDQEHASLEIQVISLNALFLLCSVFHCTLHLPKHTRDIANHHVRFLHICNAPYG